MGKYKIEDLMGAVPGVTRAGVHYYVQRKVLPRPEGRGRGRIYGEEHLVRLRAARTLRAQGLLIDDMRFRLDRASPQELHALAAALPGTPTTAPAPPAPTPQPSAAASSSSPPCASQHWERIELIPGLEIHFRSDGGPLLGRLAGEIHARYALGR